MKITIAIPDWADERHIRILAGIELAAVKLAHENFWRIKETRCDQCGKCCQGFTQGKHFFDVINGDCEHLRDKPGPTDQKECAIAINRPHACSNDPIHMIERGECCITYRIVKQ